MGEGNTGQQFDFGQMAQMVGGLFNTSQNFKRAESIESYYNFIAGQYDKQGRFIAERASRDMGDIQTRAKVTQAGQKAAIAGSGFTQSVTTDDILKDTAKLASLDELAIKYNADIKMWEARSQSILAKKAGKQAKEAAQSEGFATLLGTASQVADFWQRWKKTGGDKE